jgi:hypothetical protein
VHEHSLIPEIDDLPTGRRLGHEYA